MAALLSIVLAYIIINSKNGLRISFSIKDSFNKKTEHNKG
jgi:hypothetical protein